MWKLGGIRNQKMANLTKKCQKMWKLGGIRKLALKN